MKFHLLLLGIFCACFSGMPGCGSTSSTPTQPSNVVVSIQPTSASLFLGQTQQFQAIITGTTNVGVTWTVNGVAGGSATVGTISLAGLYTAPAILPTPASVTVTAVSHADSQASASVIVSLKDDIVVAITPPTASLPTGAAQVFTALVTGTGNPSMSVTWSVNGISGGDSSLGTVVSNGADTALYTAPAIVPSQSTVTVTATSVADKSKTSNATVTITCSATNLISPSTINVALGQSQAFAASFCLSAGSTITWDVNGIAGGNSNVGQIASTGGNTALYSAPSSLPSPNPVTIHATASSPGGPVVASASVTVTSSVGVSVSPPSDSLLLNQRKSFTSTVTNTSDTTVTWLVNGVQFGNSSVGQICVTASNPCAAPVGPISGSVDYLAPAALPATNPVTLTAVSHADNSKSGFAVATITSTSGVVSVTISPSYSFLSRSTGTLSTQQFFARVTGTSSTAVTWRVQSGVAGQGCAGAACGSVDANGVYSAPTSAPSPNAISIIVTSQADSTKSAAATIAISSGPVIEAILPSSVLAGAIESFPLSVHGVNFVAGSGSAASVILLNGASRSTTCQTATTCTTAVNPIDLQTPGTVSVQIQNPGSPAPLSNPVGFVIARFDVSEDVISLTSAQPSATAKNIVVVEPSTAASAAAIDVDFIGFFTNGNTCGVQGSPLTITRPSSGSSVVSICVHGNGLDPTFTYSFTGPSGTPVGSDIGVTPSLVSGGFPNTIQLALQISSTTFPGLRALFITTLNNDRAAATGMLEVK